MPEHGTLQERTHFRFDNKARLSKVTGKKWTFAAWNVRTLLNKKNWPIKRTAVILQEFKKYKIDIAALSETRLADEGKLLEDVAGYTLYWKGVAPCKKHKGGVGIAVSTQITAYITEIFVGINDCIMYMKLRLPQSHEITVINVYVPTLNMPDCEKEHFYGELQNVLSKSKSKDNICGEFFD